MSLKKRLFALTAESDGKLYDHNTQIVTLTGFSGTDSFKLTYNAVESAAITRGSTYSVDGISAVVLALTGRSDFKVLGLSALDNSVPTDAGFSLVFDELDDGVAVKLFTVTSGVGVTGAVTSPEGKTVYGLTALLAMKLADNVSVNATVDVTLADATPTTIFAISQVDASEGPFWGTAGGFIATEDTPAGEWTRVELAAGPFTVKGASWTNADEAVVSVYGTDDAAFKPKKQDRVVVTLSSYAGTDSFQMTVNGVNKTAAVVANAATFTVASMTAALRAVTGGNARIEVKPLSGLTDLSTAGFEVWADEGVLAAFDVTDESNCTETHALTKVLKDMRGIEAAKSYAQRLAARA